MCGKLSDRVSRPKRSPSVSLAGSRGIAVMASSPAALAPAFASAAHPAATPAQESTDWLTLDLPAYNPDFALGGSSANGHDMPFGPLPTLDVEALYIASLLKLAHPRSFLASAQQVKYRFRSASAAYAFSHTSSISLLSPPSSSTASIPIPPQALQSALIAQVDSSLSLQQRATTRSIHAYLSTRIKHLILHFQTALPDNWRYVTAEAYAEAHATASGSKARGSWSRYFAKGKGIRLVREARLAYVQPQLVRAGIWELQAGPKDEVVKEGEGAELSPTERGSAMHGLNEAKSKKSGKGLRGSGRAQAGKAFAVMKVRQSFLIIVPPIKISSYCTPTATSKSERITRYTRSAVHHLIVHQLLLALPLLQPDAHISRHPPLRPPRTSPLPTPDLPDSARHSRPRRLAGTVPRRSTAERKQLRTSAQGRRYYRRADLACFGAMAGGRARCRSGIRRDASICFVREGE